ncbi:MAG: GNAT family N-acetyltransferase [Chloroflexota bacterium]
MTEQVAVEIRPLGLADYEAICGVWEASGVRLQRTGRESYEAFSQQMATGLQTILGAIVDGKLAGIVLATHDGRKGWINRLGVLPEFQRRGVGAALVSAAETLLHEQGLTIIAALVEHHNTASLGLFQREGYLVNDVYYLSKRDHPNA